MRDVVFAYPETPRVIDLSKLYNQEETGVMQKIISMEKAVVAKGEQLIQEVREQGELPSSTLHAFYEWLDLYLDESYALAFGGDDAGGINPLVMNGDLNFDNQVDISDVTILVEIILTGADVTAAADVNGDGVASIADVTAVVDMILGNQTQ